jgi:hypothetical protein
MNGALVPGRQQLQPVQIEVIVFICKEARGTIVAALDDM